jgi:hypothetical protein
VVSLVKSLLQRNVLPGLDSSINGDAGDEYSRFSWTKDHPFDSELYT